MERIFCKIKRVKRKLDGKRITAKVMSAVLIASSMLNAFAPVAAYAAEPELATVSLSETQHGKLSFDGTEDMTLAVEVGTDVTVNVTPDEGYFSDGITVFKGEEDGSAVDVKDGKASFTVEGDTIVTSTFYENGSVGSAALQPVEVDEGKAVTSVEGYIRAHADAKYVGEGDEMSRADVLTVTTNVIDGNKLPEGTLDALWADDDGDGMSDHWEAMLSQATSHAVLFEVDPKADYYVGWVGADISGAKLTEWLAAENNADAKMREGFIVDEATGLVYVPKSYTEKNDKGEPVIASSRIQLVYTTSDKAAEASFDFDSDASDVKGDVADKGKISVPVSSAITRVTLANDGDARDSINGRTIDSVTVNGIEYTPDMGMWQYDAETGSLEFAMAPVGIHAMSVKMSDNLGKGIASFFRMPEPRMSLSNIGTIEFKSAPQVGQTFRTSGVNHYRAKGMGSGYTHPAVEGNGRWESKTLQQAMGWQGVDLSQLNTTGASLMRGADIAAQDTGTVKITNDMHLALLCCHAGTQLDPNFNSNPGWNNPNDTDGDGNEWTDRYGQQFRVFQVSAGKAIVAVVCPTSHTQPGAGFFEIDWRVVAGKLSIHKSSANPGITDGNDCYSLEGAEFTVYNAAGQSMGVLRTNANGDTNTLELPESTYTVRETKPPKGYLPAPDQQITVRGGQQTTAQVTDMPSGDPMRMAVGKYDGDTEYKANNLPQGSASLEGAEFTVEYFDTVDYDNYDALKKAGVKPTRSWVFRTNANGIANFTKNDFVSGDEFYLDTNGNPTMPRGSVAVYESKAPVGYKLNDDVSFQKIQDDYLSGVTTFNLPEIPETVIRGGVSVQKLDSETGQTPQGGASLEGITFSIINDNPNAVTVDGKSYNPGQTVKNIVTDKSGVAKTPANCLPYGKYIIRETATNDGYLNTSNEMRVTVSEDGKMYSFNAKDDIVRGGEEITKHDIETGTGDPLGGASLDGTQFQVKSLNDKPVIVGGVTYTKGQVIQPLLTIEDGHASSDAQWLPFGLYSIQEVKAGEGYLLTDGEEHRFRISKDGALVNPFDGAFENQVMRSDLEFTKKGEDGQDRLAGVAFKLTSKTTGESHVVVTDENGYFSSASSWNKHTHETNANDWALDTEGVIDSSKLDATAGVWFGGTTPDDSKGALPYDTYLIEELRCTANEGYQLIETSVIVSRDGKVYDFGTLTDVKASITTKAYDPMDGDSLVGMGEVKVSDKVTYANLFPNRDYKLTAELHDSATGDVLLDASGHPITVEKRFTAQSPTGFEVVEFTIDTIELGGKTVTVYERLYDEGGSLIAEHADKSDVNQQVTVIEPEIGTTAVDAHDGDKSVATDDKATVTDRVAYKNLVPGKEYALKGTLHIRKTDGEGNITGEPLKVDGKPVKAETVFTPDAPEGTVDVTFTFDSLALKDKTKLVAFESLEHDGHELATHADIEDEGQTVTIRNPRISTTALDGIDNDKNIVTDDETVIIDTVSHENLVPGREYTIKGSVQVKGEKDGEAVAKPLEVDGKPVTAETTFTPEKSDGTANVTFRFSSRDIDDENQTVTVTHPEIGTTAVDGADGDKNVITDDTTEVIDTVEYTGLIPGKEYTLKGTLHVKVTDEEGKVTEKPLEVDGKPVTAETTFTPEKADGKVDVVFHFNSLTIPHDTEIVAFESLEKNGVEIAAHADIEDKAQTVTVKHPFITTSALDGIDGDKNIVTDDETVIVDTVKYSGLIPGKEYTLKGAMQVKKSDEDGNLTAEPLEVDGEPVTAETTFTPETASGEVEVTFTFDSRTIADKTDIVVFESLERTGVEIASHTDIEDGKQTTTVTRPQIGTTALDGHDGDKNVVTDGKTTVIDTVEYKNVIPGKTYTLKGSLHVKVTDEEGNVTEKALEVDGKPVTAETTFTPEKSDGKVEVTFTFDSTGIPQNTEMVAFESLEKNGVELVAHADIEDGKQTTTAHVTGISTTATDGLDGDKNVIADAETTITDDVAYENALTGIGYTMTGILMDAETGLPILTGDGSEKYTEADVAAFMQQLLDVLGLSAQDEDEGIADIVVSDETAEDGSVKKSQTVRVHADGTFEVIDTTYETDEDGLTSATVDASGKVGYDALTDEQKKAVSDVAVLKDSGIVLNYSATGELPVSIDMDALGKFIADNEDLISHLVYQTAEFTPEKYDGTVTMDFHFNANDVIDRLGGETKDIVVFEVMSKNAVADEEGSAPVIVASECDLDSEEQTVNLVPTVIGTTATDKSDGDHTLMAGKDAVITDRVTYEGLIPGKEYTLKATLMDKKTGEMLSINDQHVTAELKFTPNSQNGTIDIDLGKFDASSLDGHDLVVFEELYKQTEQGNEATEVLVAEHKDIDDEGQTVTVTTTPPGGFFGKTGGNDFFIVVSIAALAVLACGCAYYGIKNRRAAKAEDAAVDEGGDTDNGDVSGDSEA